MLVFGGDEVYPYPTRAEYDTRTETPYKLAFAGRAAPGRVCDSRQPRLVRQPGRVLAHVLPAGARLRRLPHAPDAQLLRAASCPPTGGCWPSTCSSARTSMSRRCSTSRRSRRAWTTPRGSSSACREPRWILEDAYPRHSSYEELTSTRFLEEKVFERKARVFLTGDLHFYKRHENAEGIQKITSGGGGAFLHPTHAPVTTQLAQWLRASARRIRTRKPRGAWPGAISCSRSSIRSPAGCTHSSTPCRPGWRRRASKHPTSSICRRRSPRRSTRRSAIRSMACGWSLSSRDSSSSPIRTCARGASWAAPVTRCCTWRRRSWSAGARCCSR